jgi:hypothetical protein
VSPARGIFFAAVLGMVLWTILLLLVRAFL